MAEIRQLIGDEALARLVDIPQQLNFDKWKVLHPAGMWQQLELSLVLKDYAQLLVVGQLSRSNPKLLFRFLEKWGFCNFYWRELVQLPLLG